MKSKVQWLFVIDTCIDHFTSPKLQSMNSFELGKKKTKGNYAYFIVLYNNQDF